jgi:hypothetical protein
MPNLYVAGAVVAALLVSHGWAFNQGKSFEKRAEARRIEATNRKIRAVNAREEAVAAKEREDRDKALQEAAPVIAAAPQCTASPELAAVLSRIK